MFGLVWLAVAILFCYITFDIILYTSLLKVKLKPVYKESYKKISVIIAAKNEAEHLQENLPIILNQNYPEFEVIVVNDHSTDYTLKVLSKLKTQFPHLKIENNQLTSSKKNALTAAINKAKYKHLVFTDADCKPMSLEWLAYIQNYFHPQESIILGYSPYKKYKGRLNSIIRFETCQTAINYFGLTNLGLPYMGVGRNLAYHKSIFKNFNGFKSHENILSGDDDLFINQASGKYTINCCLNPKTFVESEPEKSFSAWINQKRRHISTAPKYKLKHRLILGFQFISKFLFWCFVLPFSIFLMFQNQLNLFISVSLIITFKIVYSKVVFSKLMVKDLWQTSIFLEFQLICLQLYIFSLNLITSKKDW